MKVIKVVSSVLLFFFAKALFSQELQKNEIKYSFQFNSENCLNVNAEFIGDASGETNIIAPWEAYNHLKENNIQYNVEGGMRVLNANVSNTKVAHNPNAKFKLNYNLCYDTSVSNAHLPVIQDEFFSFYSTNVLVYPSVNLDKKLKFIFDFSSLPKNNKVFSSFGEGRKIEVNKNIAEILFSQFVGGGIHPSIINIKNKPIYLIEHGEWSFFKDKSAQTIIKDLSVFQRNEMQDYDFPFYVITLIKQPDSVPFKTISGVHTKNSLTLTFPDGKIEKFPKVLYVLSHELFHNWLGSKIEVPLNLRNKYRWFFEGFTDYLALKMAKDGGFITNEQYADILNFHIVDYYSSILNTIPNALYARLNNQSVGNYNFIQTRGHLLALAFSELLKDKNLPDDTIKVFINSLIQTSSENNNKLTEEAFWHCFDKYFDPDFKGLVKKHIFNGEMIMPPAIEGFHFIEKEIDVVEPGFNIIETINKGKLTKISKKSPAFQSGLVENATFKTYKLANDNLNNPQLCVVLQINHEDKEIQFKPEFKKVKIYQYSSVSDPKT